MKSLPASVSTINFVMWYGLRRGHVVAIADARKAYLQAPLRSPIPTFVILPREIWHASWFRKYRRVAAPLRKAMYGHPTSGDDWSEYFDETVVFKLQGSRIESFPSLWHFPSLDVVVAAYVDDIVASGPTESVQAFWRELRKYITVDSVEVPGRYLGRDHLIFELHGFKKVFLSMADYAVSSFKFYEEQFNQTLKVYDTPFVNEAVLTPQGFEDRGVLASKAAQLLMKLLWLPRLSRPDLAFAIASLAGAISNWSRNHDLMLYRLLGYVKGTVDMGLLGTVSTSTSVIPSLLVCGRRFGRRSFDLRVS